MGRPASMNFHGRQLIRELKRLRKKAGLKQEEAATNLHLTLQKISRIENGQIPGYHETVAILALYGLGHEDMAKHLGLWELAKQRPWWAAIPGVRDVDYLCMEQEAVTLTEFQLGRLPELLQTEAYAREYLYSVVPGYDDADEIETAVGTLIRRQDRLYADDTDEGRPPPLILNALIHEPVLAQGIDHEQMTRLVERAQLPNVTVRIVPQSAGAHGGLDSSVALFGFDDPEEPDVAFTKTVLGLIESQDEDWTTPIRAMLDNLTGLAMSPQESLSLLKSRLDTF